jgi:C1A family cysteine protease
MSKTISGKGLGYLPDQMDRRDLLYSAPLAHLQALPARVDLRTTGYLPDPYDQGELGSCTANASGMAFQFVNRKQGRDDILPSRLFTYYNSRDMEGTVKSDAGAFVRDAIKSLAQYGDCAEDLWPYEIAKFTVKPKAKCYKKASKHQALQYARVARSLSQMKGCLAGGLPFVIGFSVYESFDSIGSDGLMPFPKDGEALVGGHAVLVVGYDDAMGRLIIRNSWGNGWGDGGDFYMPYSIALDENQSDDFWRISMTE